MSLRSGGARINYPVALMIINYPTSCELCATRAGKQRERCMQVQMDLRHFLAMLLRWCWFMLVLIVLERDRGLHHQQQTTSGLPGLDDAFG